MKKIYRGLILKDLYTLKSYTRTIVFFFLAFMLIGITQKETVLFFPFMMVFICSMCALATFSYDDQAKSDKYILSLPINRRDVVRSKYILVILFSLLGVLVGIIIGIIIHFLKVGTAGNVLELLYTMAGAYFGIGLVTSVQIPCIFKYGAEKGRINMFVIFILIALFIGAITFLWKHANISIDIVFLKPFLNQFGIPLLLLITGILHYVSYLISVKIYNKREV